MQVSRESIFITAIRGFLKIFAVVLGLSAGILVISLAFSAFSGKIRMPEKSQLTVSPDANWEEKILPDSAPVLLRIDTTGVIGMGNLKTDKIKKMLVDSRVGVLSGDRVKGILLYINSPGGSANVSSGIYSLLKEYKERYKIPIFAYVDGMCASGGMYIACAADQIYASSDSIVGSVGVRLGPAFNFFDAMEKVGVSALTLTEGKNKDTLNPFRRWKEGEGKTIQAVLASTYDQFVDIVTQNRKRLSRKKLVDEYGAKIFIAEKAKHLGYIDNSQAQYNDALRALAQASGIAEDQKYQVLEIEPPQSIFKNLTENNTQLLSGKLHHVFPTGIYTNSDMSGQILYLYQP